jgi:hypothetical protein
MKVFKRMMVLTMMVFFLLVAVNQLTAQEKYSVLTGKVIEIRRPRWIVVQSDKDKAVVNVRYGRKTAFIPPRELYTGARVKVEYLTDRGTPVAYTVTILDASK